MKLKKELALLDVFCLAAGTMISSGIFILPGIVFAKAGPAMILGYLLAGVLAIPAMLSKAELMTAMPRAGGTFFYVDRSLGPLWGMLAGVASWLALSLKSAFALFGIGAILLLIWPNMDVLHLKMIASAFVLIFMVLNLFGSRHAGGITRYLVLALMGILVFYVSLGIFHIKESHFHPFFPKGIGSVFYIAAIVTVSYGGLTKITNAAGEVKNPAKNIPLGMFLAFIVVTILYALVSFVTVGIVPPSNLAHSLTPISEGAKALGKVALVLTSLAAVFSFVSTGNAGIMSSSRIPMAMSYDGHLPPFLEEVDPDTHVPYKSVFLTSAFMIASIMLMDLKLLVKTASIMQIIIFIFALLSVIVMRESNIGNYLPKYKSPLYPWLHIAGVLGYSIMITTIGTKPLQIALVVMGLSLLWYFFYSHHQVKRRVPALNHVMYRISSNPSKRIIWGSSLREELKEIVRQRDEIKEDDFDHLVKKSTFIDIEENMDYEELFKIVAMLISPELGVEKEYLLEKLMKVEEEVPSLLKPRVSITKLLLKNYNSVFLLAARAKKGIYFSPSAKPVISAFILIGSPKHRIFYTQAGVILSQIVSEEGFLERWKKATTGDELRDVLHLSERCRIKDENRKSYQ